MAFAVGELGLRLEEFYDMAWCEFLLKSFAYHRIKDNEWELQRLLNYNILISSSVDTKKLPKFDKFLKAKETGRTSNVTDEARELFRQRVNEYNEKIKNKGKNKNKDE